MNLNRYSTHVLCFFLQKERSEKRMAKKREAISHVSDEQAWAQKLFTSGGPCDVGAFN
jgi:hypothetical protein